MLLVCIHGTQVRHYHFQNQMSSATDDERSGTDHGEFIRVAYIHRSPWLDLFPHPRVDV